MYSLKDVPSIDFETFSLAGYVFKDGRYFSIVDKAPHGLGAVGTKKYAAHSSTEILSLAYDDKLWVPGSPPPLDLFDHVRRGGLLRAWHSYFEFCIWNEVGVKLGWPPIQLHQFIDTMAAARFYGLPGKLADACKAINSEDQKDARGKTLMKIFSSPVRPTKKHPHWRWYPNDKPDEFDEYLVYNLYDVKTEKSIANKIDPLPPFEQIVFNIDQKINDRGIAINEPALNRMAGFITTLLNELEIELREITAGRVENANKLDDMKKWIREYGVECDSLNADAIVEMLERPLLPPTVRRVLELRQLLSSASVKKVFAIQRQIHNGRLYELLSYSGAERTHRWAGGGPQPHNLKSKGPTHIADWKIEQIRDVLNAPSLQHIVDKYKDALSAIGGALRGLFCAKPGHTLYCGDFRAIEAVVLAALAGEQWRLDVFKTHGKIYETSASKITGLPLSEFENYLKTHGKNHPYRNAIGKVAELASGYGGWINAWLQFGAGDHFDNDKDIKDAILKWRQESPRIVEFWGGQWRKNPYKWEFCHEYFGVEGNSILAILNPDRTFTFRDLKFRCDSKRDIFQIKLPSGNKLTYHQPRLHVETDRFSKNDIYAITFMGKNNDPKVGPKIWMRLRTNGGRLTENIVQSVARDLLANAIVNVEAAGYPVVLHVHDEIIAEVPIGFKSLDNFLKIMVTPPVWAAEWAISADGWEGVDYRKD